jgi:hypothetical protein
VPDSLPLTMEVGEIVLKLFLGTEGDLIFLRIDVRELIAKVNLWVQRIQQQRTHRHIVSRNLIKLGYFGSEPFPCGGFWVSEPTSVAVMVQLDST